MAARLPFQAPKASAYDRNRRALPMLQRHGHFSKDFPEIISNEATGVANTMQAPPAIQGRPQGTQGVQNCLWVYREQLISLFWEQDLPLREVQEIMKKEHGLDISMKVYKTQFRRWGIRKNLKGHEALKIAAGKESNPNFWPDDRVDEYVARIDRHVKKRYRQNQPISHAHAGTVVTPSRRIRAPDVLEKVEAGSYYLSAYFDGRHGDCTSWFATGPCSEELNASCTLFTRGLIRLSRNDQKSQAFKEINLAFEYLKHLISLDHPLVYLRLMTCIAALSQYPKSEVCSAVCRMLSDYLGKLSWIVHGSSHPLNHTWGESLVISAAEGPECFVLGVAVNIARRCWQVESRIGMGSIDIEKWVPSEARGLDEASLRNRLASTGSRPDLLPQAQETRLALSELLITQFRMPEALYFFAEAKAFQDADPIRRATKAFWMAELHWRTGDARGSINALESALASDEVATLAEGGTDIGITETMKQEIQDVLHHRQNLLVLRQH